MTKSARWLLLPALFACSGSPETAAPKNPYDLPDGAWEAFKSLAPPELPPPPADVTNRYLDDDRAAVLGKKFFFEKRFSGPLLDDANNGASGTLGVKGETGKVSCSGCHLPEFGFLDGRSPRKQISLGAGWTRRRAPSLLDVAQNSFLMWDGRRDAFFNQPFTPLEDPLEFNSSRLFVAQQIARLYRDEYEAIFGPLPAALDDYEPISAHEAGCSELPTDVAHGSCEKPGAADPDVTRVVVNMAKAIQAFTRKISCGPSRFDAWVNGDPEALTEEEQAGAVLFVGKAGCTTCHKGPYFTDRKFHNVGMIPDYTFFVTVYEDTGAQDGIAAMLQDPLNAKGEFSDGYDNRHELLERQQDTELLGSFRTPGLRCVSRRPSYMHTGQFRSLEDVVLFFNKGGDPPRGYLGTSENKPRGLTDVERAQLVAFLRALDGTGPDGALLAPPELAPDPAD